MKKKQVIDKYIEPIFSSGTIYIIKNMDVNNIAKRFNYKCPTTDDEFKQDLINSQDSSGYYLRKRPLTANGDSPFALYCCPKYSSGQW